MVTERPKPLYHFLTAICAVIGGVFTVMGILDSLFWQARLRGWGAVVVEGGWVGGWDLRSWCGHEEPQLVGMAQHPSGEAPRCCLLASHPVSCTNPSPHPTRLLCAGEQDNQKNGDWEADVMRLPGRRPRTAPLLVKALLINALLLCRVLSHALPLLLTLAYCFPLL